MEQERRKSGGGRKQITFDLSQKTLAVHYPRPKVTINPKYYKKAYADISRFMKKNGFEHRQFSVYTSNEKITNTDINLLMEDLAKELPWFILCVNQIDVTNIGTQHSLLQALETAAYDLHVSPEKKQAATPAEDDRRNGSHNEA
ncbi:MAG: hypothetical protein LBD95_02635 [Clostridiales Family XIII bacterium]|nr:hypothetical protein [Clostridiales Family XIII bacterium]